MPIASCSPRPVATHFVVPTVDLVPCVGWTKGTPKTMAEGADATAATLHAKNCDERKMIAAAKTLAAVPKSNLVAAGAPTTRGKP